MADFTLAIKKTLAHEGGWVHHGDDPGGETVFGVTRRDHPGWFGWTVVDVAKASPSFPGNLSADPALRELAERLYKKFYWDPWHGDDCPSQAIAEELFDTAVNASVAVGVRFLQRALNALNRAGRLYPDLTVDGDMGPRTLHALNILLSNRDSGSLMKAMNVLQGAYYLELTTKNERLESFIRGWLAQRVSIG